MKKEVRMFTPAIQERWQQFELVLGKLGLAKRDFIKEREMQEMVMPALEEVSLISPENTIKFFSQVSLLNHLPHYGYTVNRPQEVVVFGAKPCVRFNPEQSQEFIFFLERHFSYGLNFKQAVRLWNKSHSPYISKEEPDWLAGAFTSKAEEEKFSQLLVISGDREISSQEVEGIKDCLKDEAVQEIFSFFQDSADKLQAIAWYLEERRGHYYYRPYLQKSLRVLPRFLPPYDAFQRGVKPKLTPPLQFSKQLLSVEKIRDLVRRQWLDEIIPVFQKEGKEDGFRFVRERINSSEGEAQLMWQEVLKSAEKAYELSLSRFCIEPDFYQRLAMLQALKEKRVILKVSRYPGSGKTLIFLGLFELIRGKWLLILPPAIIRQVEGQIRSYFKEPLPRYLVVRSLKDAERADLSEIELVIVSSSLLVQGYREKIKASQFWKEMELAFSPVAKVLFEIPFRGLIWDEAHTVRNFAGSTSYFVFHQFTRKAELEYLVLSTGTPIYDKLSDLAALASAIEPEKYPKPRHFSSLLFFDPLKARLDFYRRKVIEFYGEEIVPLPEVQGISLMEPLKQPEILELSPAHRAIYLYLLGLRLYVFSKLQLLRQAALNPLMVRGKKVLVQRKDGDQMRLEEENIGYPYSGSKNRTELLLAFRRYEHLKQEKPSLVFDEDFLCENGFEELFLSSFFNLPKGVSELVEKYGSSQMREAWQSTPLSTVFREVLKIVPEELRAGYCLFIPSALYKETVTSDSLDSLVALLKKQEGEERVISLDGTQNFGQRNARRERWRKEPELSTIVVTAASSGLGQEFSILPEKEAAGITSLFIDLPYSPGALWQGICRPVRRGQEKPVKCIFLEAADTIMEGVRILLERKMETIRIIEKGYDPLPEDRKLLTSPRYEARLLSSYLNDPRGLAASYFSKMRRQSSSENYHYLQEFDPDFQFLGKSRGEILAQAMMGEQTQWLNRLPSIVAAKIVKELTSGAEKARVLDSGAGVMSFQQEFGEPVIGIDICVAALIGNKSQDTQALICSSDSLCFKERTFDCILLSKVLHYFDAKVSEVIEGHLRVLKEEGYIIIIEPANFLDKNLFRIWRENSKALGVEILPQYSGYAKVGGKKYSGFGLWLLVGKKSRAMKESTDANSKDSFLFFQQFPHTSYSGERVNWREKNSVVLNPAIPHSIRDSDQLIIFDPITGKEMNSLRV